MDRMLWFNYCLINKPTLINFFEYFENLILNQVRNEYYFRSYFQHSKYMVGNKELNVKIIWLTQKLIQNIQVHLFIMTSKSVIVI